jgi:hypothetical protein
MGRAKIISVLVEQGEAGLLHGTSPQMKELFVSGETIEEIVEAVPEVIKAIYSAHGQSVSVVPADYADGIPMPWVILTSHNSQLGC